MGTVAVLVAGLLLAGGLAVLGWLRRRLVVVTVEGPSMRPAFLPGDRVLVRRAGLPGVRGGDVVVVERPERPGRWPMVGAGRVRGRAWMIKRVAALPGDPVPSEVVAALGVTPGSLVPPGRLVVLGDNASASWDSRGCGYFPADRLLGIVVRRLGG